MQAGAAKALWSGRAAGAAAALLAVPLVFPGTTDPRADPRSAQGAQAGGQPRDARGAQSGAVPSPPAQRQERGTPRPTPAPPPPPWEPLRQGGGVCAPPRGLPWAEGGTRPREKRAAGRACAGSAAWCGALAAAQERKGQLLLLHSPRGGGAAGLLRSAASVSSAAVALCCAEGDAACLAAAEGTGVAVVTASGGWLSFALAAVAGGVAVLALDAGRCCRLLRDPFAHLVGDADVEAVSLGWDGITAQGHVHGISDEAMGWSGYGETLRISLLSAAVFFVQASEGGEAFLQALVQQPQPLTDEALSSELLLPAHDGVRRSGAQLRVLDPGCWATEERMRRSGRSDAVLVLCSPPGHAKGPMPHIADLNRMQPRDDVVWKETTALGAEAAERDCVPARRGPGAAVPLRPLLADGAPFPDPAHCAGSLAPMCAVVREAADPATRDVMVAVSNKNILPMLGLFIDGAIRAGVRGLIVTALDEETRAFARKQGAHSYLRKLTALGGGTDNHATSGLKFGILQELLRAGANVLLTDVDVVFVQNPFPLLYRDSDAEGMTDGWDDETAYGWVADVADPSAGSPPVRRFLRWSARNSGLFYARSTVPALRLMDSMRRRMARERVWDQSAYNQELLRPAYGDAAGDRCRVRVMSYVCFANSKVMFRGVRGNAGRWRRHRPAAVHVNYHPEKFERMQSLFAFYHKGQSDALSRWAGSEGTRRHDCPEAPFGERAMEADPQVVARIEGTGPWRWNATRLVTFGPGGSMPGGGRWAPLPGGTQYHRGLVLELGGTRWRAALRGMALVAWQCGGGEEVFARFEGNLCVGSQEWPLAGSEAARAVGGDAADQLSGRGWKWAGSPGFHFASGGTLETPWGQGTWGLVPGRSGAAWAGFVGRVHLLRKDPAGGQQQRWVSTRCDDGDRVALTPA
eukprot:TRINITY_DN31761_c0_g1_i1.p1 TRINITY_DN31761_c0_g1~~TRINITY_DN31761_c0_g1_i1.p1  ORF type:complete len:941 (+),score=259.99 TRINITY_DN31761_c0_g1_i1:69-2825(+)